VFTVILYLTDDADSTAFPVFKLDEFAVPEFAAADEHTVTNAAAMQATVQRGCLDKERYVRWPVRVGDMALFMQSTMVCRLRRQHQASCRRRERTLDVGSFSTVVCACTCLLTTAQHFGTHNTVTQERQALFSVLTPFDGARQDGQCRRGPGVAAAIGGKRRAPATDQHCRSSWFVRSHVHVCHSRLSDLSVRNSQLLSRENSRSAT